MKKIMLPQATVEVADKGGGGRLANTLGAAGFWQRSFSNSNNSQEHG